MKYYLVAGEASGDLHGSNLIKALKNQDSEAEIRCYGGELMEAEGATLVKHYKELAFMGFIEVLINLRTILTILKACKKDIKAFQPDVLILIDYPGFNFKLLPFAKDLGIRTVYYISPKLWAWNEGRIHTIKKYVDQLLLILPFEVPFYEKHSYKADYVGHPLLDATSSFKNQIETSFENSSKIIALLPGSRTHEVRAMLPIMLSLIPFYPNYQFVIGKASSLEHSFYESLIGTANVLLSEEGTYPLLARAHCAVVTSGTATLETALFRVLQVVCYKGNPISYIIARLLVRHIKYISLVNLILDRLSVVELIQNDLTEEALRKEVDLLLDSNYRVKIQQDYDELIALLGDEGASERAAELIIQGLKNRN